MRRRAAVAASLLVATLVVMGAILVFRPHATTDGDIRLLGLEERGEVLRDDHGVPHIFARNAHDLFFLQGYVVAQDRLFQMDLYRRAAHGTLSEVLGEATLAADRLTRTLGFGRAAARDLELLSAEGRAASDAFAQGVNKFVEQHGETLPLEFTLLGYRPGPWSALDSAAITKLQAYDVAVNLQTELLRAGVAQRLGLAAIPAFFPEPAGTVPIDPRAWEEVAASLSPSVAVEGDLELSALVGTRGLDAGSNCWAVSGARTASGRPLLAGDPHLGVRNPSIWYEVALDGAGYRVIGFTIPGIPGVIAGHNERIAWSITVAFIDQQDLYVERPDPSDPRRYLFRGTSEPARITREPIRVKGRDPVALDVVTTRHGPIVTPVLKGQQAQLALRWTALEGGTAIDAILALDRARDWASFRAGLALVEGPASTFCYADVDGHVGWAIGGRIPVRAFASDGRVPVAGWTGEHEWTGVLPSDRTPAVLDPPGGIALSANQLQFAERPAIGSFAEWDGGFRAARLAEALATSPRLSTEDSRLLQTDTVSLPRRRLRAPLDAAMPGSALATAAQRAAREWDGDLRADSPGAAVYETWLFHMLGRTFRDKLGDALFADWIVNGRPFVALHALVDKPDDALFVEIGTGLRGRDALASLALEDAAKELGQRLGTDASRWRWGTLHAIRFDHPLGGALGLLNIGPHERPGDDDTVSDAPYDMTKPYAQRNHASFRMIVDLADMDAARSVLPTGQSGQLYDRHWGDQTALWLRGELKPMVLSRSRLAHVEAQLITRAR